MVIVFFVAIVVAFTVLEQLSGVIVDGTIRVIVSILITGVCILGYRLSRLGYLFKTLTSMVFSYKVLLPIATLAASFLVKNEKLLIVQIIATLAGGAAITKLQIDTTKYTFLESDPHGRFDLDFNFSGFKRLFKAIRLTKFGWNKKKIEREKKEQEKKERENMEHHLITVIEQLTTKSQQLEEAKECIRNLLEQIDSEKRENNKKEREPIGFFDGCKNKEEIKVRYRKLVQEYHPDSTRGHDGMFKKIQLEYEGLKDENRL